MRDASDTDFAVDVAGVGTFTFARRTYGDRLKIRAEYLRLVGDLGDQDQALSTQAAVMATHRVLCVAAPDGWQDLSAIDLVAQPDAEDKIFALYIALKDKEDSFRASADQGGKAARA